MMEIFQIVGEIVLVDDKGRSYISSYVKDGYDTVFYVVSTCQEKVSWTLMLGYFMQNQNK